MNEEIIKCKTITTEDNEEITIDLIKKDLDFASVYTLEVNGIQWLSSRSLEHASIIFEMFVKHYKDYMQYLKP